MGNEPKMPSGRAVEAILESLAAAVMSTEATDDAAVEQLLALLDELAETKSAVAPMAVAAAARIRAQAADVRALAEALDETSETVARMQDAVSRGTAPGSVEGAPAEEKGASTDPDAFVLPPWGDEKTLNDFLGAQRGSLEELEAAILGMEEGDKERVGAFKRKLHTMKGEAGVLGLDDLERVCHATEDFIEKRPMSPEVADRLLKVRDWMLRAVESYAKMRRPKPSGERLIEALLGAGDPSKGPGVAKSATPPEQSAPEPKPPAAAAVVPEPAQAPPVVTVTPVQPPPVARPPEVERVARDEETVSLFGEFLGESAEGLNRVDQTLMNVERDGVGEDSVNSLFRVFHTVKGTAGFLELTDVVALAHDTETMLNKCRENALKLEGVVIDLVFDATAKLRELLLDVRTAIEQGTAIPSRPGLEVLLKKIQDATEGKKVPEKELPFAAEGEKLGEVITHAPLSVPKEAVEAALRQQAATGRRLGEELVASGAAEPEQVAQALRAQARIAQAASEEGSAKLKETIKVDLERVDSLVEMIGELVVVESMVVNAPEITKTSSVRVRNCLAQLAKVTRDLQDVGMRMRMVPVAGVFQKMARLVRDLSRKSGKQVRLITAGESTEMDRSMVEQIADPLVHMIRNSMDHGLESTEGRIAAKKPPVGRIELSAYHEGGSVIIEIVDDGRGLDKEAILKKAIEKGLINGTGAGMTEAEIHGLIFAPGFSTAAKVTEISGRGVGMDVVKRNIEAMRGRILISSTPGAGTKFKLVLPLTLAIIDGMLVACGKERYIIPTLSIVESIQPDRKMLVSLAQKNEMLNLRGEILPLIRLDRLFSLQDAKNDPTEALVVVVEGAGRRIGLLVDDVVTQQQVVIKSLGEGLGHARFISGAAILSDGRVGLILNIEDVAGLVQKNQDYLHARAPVKPTNSSQEARI